MPQIFEHNFHSVDSATAMPFSHVGQKTPTPTAGTWGVRGLKGYSVGDLTNQGNTWSLEMAGDPRMYELRTAGHLASGTINRYALLAFKTLDASNSLVASVNGTGNFVVSKVDAGVSTALLTVAVTKPGNGVEYGIGIVLSGNNVQAYFNGVYVGTISLTGAEALKYLIYSKVGVVEIKAGAPTTNLDFNRLSVWEGEWPSWQH